MLDYRLNIDTRGKKRFCLYPVEPTIYYSKQLAPLLDAVIILHGTNVLYQIFDPHLLMTFCFLLLLLSILLLNSDSNSYLYHLDICHMPVCIIDFLCLHSFSALNLFSYCSP